MIEEAHDFGYTIDGGFNISKELIEKYGLRYDEGSTIVIQRFGFTIAVFNEFDRPELNLAKAIAWCQEHYKDIPSVPPGILRGYLPALKQRGFRFWFDSINCVWVLSNEQHVYTMSSHEETREVISEVLKYPVINLLTAHQTGEHQPMMSGEPINQKFYAIIKTAHNEVQIVVYDTYEQLHKSLNNETISYIPDDPVIHAISEKDLKEQPELADTGTWNVGSYMLIQGNIRVPVQHTEVMLKWR